MATEDQIERAVTRLLDTLDKTRAEVPGDPDDQDRVIREAVFRIAVQVLDGREQLAAAGRTCGEARP